MATSNFYVKIPVFCTMQLLIAAMFYVVSVFSQIGPVDNPVEIESDIMVICGTILVIPIMFLLPAFFLSYKYSELRAWLSTIVVVILTLEILGLNFIYYNYRNVPKIVLHFECLFVTGSNIVCGVFFEVNKVIQMPIRVLLIGTVVCLVLW